MDHWRAMAPDDQAALDAEYNLRARVPDFAAYFARYDEVSVSVYERFACERDLAYGDGPRQCVDVFPAGSSDAPMFVFIHGGYWRSMERRSFAFAAPPFIAAGAAVALVEYDLAPAARMTAIVAQVAKAVAFLSANAARFGASGGKLHLAGHSAGGHLAACVLAGLGGPATPVASACLLSGLFDLEPIRRSFLNADLALDEAEVAALSPLRLPLVQRPQILVTLGGDETAGFHAQSAAYAARLEREGAAYTTHAAAGENHFSIVEGLGDAAHPVTRWILARMAEPLRSPPPPLG